MLYRADRQVPGGRDALQRGPPADRQVPGGRDALQRGPRQAGAAARPRPAPGHAHHACCSGEAPCGPGRTSGRASADGGRDAGPQARHGYTALRGRGSARRSARRRAGSWRAGRPAASGPLATGSDGPGKLAASCGWTGAAAPSDLARRHPHAGRIADRGVPA